MLVINNARRRIQIHTPDAVMDRSSPAEFVIHPTRSGLGQVRWMVRIAYSRQCLISWLYYCCSTELKTTKRRQRTSRMNGHIIRKANFKQAVLEFYLDLGAHILCADR